MNSAVEMSLHRGKESRVTAPYVRVCIVLLSVQICFLSAAIMQSVLF